MQSVPTDWVRIYVGIPEDMSDAAFRDIVGAYTKRNDIIVNLRPSLVLHHGRERCFVLELIACCKVPDIRRGQAEKLARYLLALCKQSRISVQYAELGAGEGRTYDVEKG